MNGLEINQGSNNLTIKLGSRIDTSNVNQIQEEILNYIKDIDKHTRLILDCSNLEYISRVGLRMIMMLMRRHSNMELIEVGPEPYNVFEVTGFFKIIPIEKKKREIDISNQEKIGVGQTGATYRLDDETIFKVFMKGINEDIISDERELAQKAFFEGILTAIPFDSVKVGDQLGIIYELIPSNSYKRKTLNTHSLGCADESVSFFMFITRCDINTIRKLLC